MGRVVVVGAGVIGLTCAVRLLEDGHRVEVVGRDLPRETTSAIAAAIWYPYKAYPFEQVTRWSAHSFDAFARLAADPDTGVTMREGTELMRSDPIDPWWASAVPTLTTTGNVRAPYVSGLVFETPVVEMPVYLDWLQERVQSLGGTVERSDLAVLPDIRDVVVNASGVGARELAGDDSVVPSRGQVVLLSQVGLERWWLDASGPTYVVPRRDDIVVGGTDEEGVWDLEPSEADAARIMSAAIAMVPELSDAQVIGHRVGLRPVRPTVRVERVGDVVHCYGHGGAGITLSWGCADEVAELVRQAL